MRRQSLSRTIQAYSLLKLFTIKTIVMPAYSYKERFVPMVLDGSKSQTVRNRRRYPAKVGDALYHYFGLRTQWVRPLRTEFCRDTHSLSISKKHGIVFYIGLLTEKQLKQAAKSPRRKSLPVLKVLSAADRDLFAWRDGFRPAGSTEQNPSGAYELMIRFWTQTHALPWSGDVIYWTATNAGLQKAKLKIKK